MEQTPLSVCLLNDSFPPSIDGVANAVLNYARAIHGKLGSAVVGVPEYPGAVDNYPFPVIRYPSVDTTQLVGYRAGYPFSAGSLGELAEAKPHIIHTHCPIMSTAVARTLRESTGAPVVLTYHTKFDLDIQRAFSNELLQRTAAHLLVKNISACDEVWVVSHGAGENLRSLGYQGDYIVMENGVDFPRGRKSPEECAALKQELDISAEIPVYLFVGRLMWYKGLKLLLDALATLHREGRQFSMVLVGDSMERQEIEAYCDELGLTNCCRFVGAVRDREKLRTYFTMADLFLFPSTFDTNGIVVREAAACGLASVLVRGSCAAEGVTDGENALLMEETPEDLAQLLRRCGENRQLLRAIGQNAMDTLYLSWEDSVYRAYQRYGIVIDNYRRGVTDRSPEWSDEFYQVMSDLCQGIEWARDLHDLQQLHYQRWRERRNSDKG